MTPENNTSTAIDAAVKNELAAIVQQAMEQHEQKKEADKTVYRRVCAGLNKELASFDYIKPDTYTDNKGKTVPYNRPVLCSYNIQTALSVLIRTAYQIDAVKKLPSEREADIRQFMLDTLERMKSLRGQ